MSQEQRMAESLIWVKRVNALREAMDKAMQLIRAGQGINANHVLNNALKADEDNHKVRIP